MLASTSVVNTWPSKPSYSRKTNSIPMQTLAGRGVYSGFLFKTLHPCLQIKCSHPIGWILTSSCLAQPLVSSRMPVLGTHLLLIAMHYDVICSL